MKEVSIIGLNLAKNVFQLHGARSDGSVAFRRKLSRAKLLSFLAATPRCLVAMEACASAHHWAQQIFALGHDVRLIAPIYVKPFVKRNKNDAADAEAIADAASRPTMRFVAVKPVEKQAAGFAFKTRDLLVRQRTQAINAVRGHMAEYGVVAPNGPPPESFAKGRDFAAWLGLTPKQNSSGGKTRLGGTSKMGQRDLRRLLVSGAITQVRWAGARRGRGWRE